MTEYWIVDPDSNRIELYRLQENPSRPERTFTSSETLTTRLLEGFALDLATVFAP